MSSIIFMGMLFFYLLINLFFFNFFKNYKYFFSFVFLFIIICSNIFILLNFNFIYLYIILLFFCIISFKFFSYLFFENSPTLYLCTIIQKNCEYQKIRNDFLSNIFIKKYLDNLINSKLIRIENNKLILEKKGKYFFLFFKYFFRLIFK